MKQYRMGLLVLMLATPGWAGSIQNPLGLEQSAVLPAGVGNPRITSLWMGLNDEFGRDGGIQPLGQPLNRRVTWGQLSAQQKDPELKALYEGIIGVNGMGEGSPGVTTGEVNTNVNVTIPTLAFGVTDRFTFAVALPIYNVEVNPAMGFVADASAIQDFLKKVSTTSSPVKAQQAAAELERLDDAVNVMLGSMGYQAIVPETITGLGDMRLVGKYRILHERKQALALKGVVTLPTGNAPDVDRALDVPTGDGQVDLGMQIAYDRFLTRRLTWNTFGGVTAQLPDQLERRIPTSSESFLSPDKDLVDRNLGDQVQLGTSLNYSFPGSGLSIGAGYQYQHQFETWFNGNKYAQYRYRLLEYFNPASDLHSGTLLATFSTVNWFQQKKFIYPFQASLVYSRGFAGMNARTSDLLSAELVLFF